MTTAELELPTRSAETLSTSTKVRQGCEVALFSLELV